MHPQLIAIVDDFEHARAFMRRIVAQTPADRGRRGPTPPDGPPPNASRT